MTVTKIKYKYTNKFITSGLIEELAEVVKYFRLQDCIRTCKKLGVDGLELRMPNGVAVTIEDIAGLEGYNAYAESVGPVWFHAGPEMIGKDKYKFIPGTVLNWFMDVILFRVVADGYEIFNKAGIPL